MTEAGPQAETSARLVEGQPRRSVEVDALLRATVEFSTDTFIITEANLEPPGPRIEYVNPAFTRLTGYSAAEVIGKSPRLLQGPDTQRDALDRLRSELAAQEWFCGETLNYRKDGTEYLVEWRISPLKNEAGEIVKWVAVQRDVTARRQAEEQREALLEAERSARSEAERVGRMKDEFLATLSHELRTPLNAILGWAQILTLGKADAHSVQEGALIISRNARVQAQMIEDLLDMSRIVSGKVRLDVQRVELADVVSAAIETVQASADARQVAIETTLARDAGPVLGDAGRLQQVVWNLLSNAVKFTPPGGRVRVRLQRSASDSQVELSVADTGQGIASDFLPYVFERFRQADASTTRAFGGLGLGLSIVKQLTELHGGSVRAASDGPGAGSSFIVSLPLSVAGTDALPASRSNDPPSQSPALGHRYRADLVSLQGVRVLVVDDDHDSRELVTRLLRNGGAKVEQADSSHRGLALLREQPFELLVSDIGMPHEDGYTLIRNVRELPNPAGRVPAIALTAFARMEDRRHALLAGFDMHLSKPVEPAQLLAVCATMSRRDASTD